MARLALLLSVAAAIAVAPAGAQSSPVANVDRLETLVLTEINAIRSARGLSLLRRNVTLDAAAAAHSLSMAENGFFSHSSFDGTSFATRIRVHYRPGQHRFWSAGENLVWGSPGLSAKQAVTLWMNSPGHRANLLSSKWREVGLGGVHATSAPGTFGGQPATILTADFGVRS